MTMLKPGRPTPARPPRRRPARRAALLLASLLGFLPAGAAVAAEVELRLVPFDQPDITVDKLEQSKPITNPVSTPQGVVMEKVGVDTVAWGRNILLDSKPVFERFHEGKYIDRLPVARPDLKPGDHVIWPGNHAFTVAADGTVSSKSPELIVSGNVVKIRAYPVTVRAFVANPDEADLPMSMRVSALPNLTIRESADNESKDEAKGGKPLELLPVFEKFSPLTLWLPANSAGKGYVIHPVGLTFHLDARGVSPAAGGGSTINDVRVEKNQIDIPLYSFPLRGDARSGARIVVQGVEQYGFANSASQRTNWYPRALPYVMQMGEVGPTIAIDGDLRKLPFKSMAVESSDPAARGYSLVAVECDSRHLKPGVPLRARVRAMDTRIVSAAQREWDAARVALDRANSQLAAANKKKSDAESAIKSNEAQQKTKSDALAKPDVSDAAKQTLTADLETLKAKREELAAALTQATAAVEAAAPRVEPLKAAAEEAKKKFDAVIDSNPLADAPVIARVRPIEGGAWRDLEVKPAGPSREFDIAIPTLPDGVYRVSLGVATPGVGDGVLTAQLPVTIAGERTIGVGVFTERGRDAFYRGESLWLGVGLIAIRGPISAGTPLTVDLVDADNRRIPIYSQPTAAAIEKRDSVIVRLSAESSLALAPGRYRVEAKVGSASARPFEFDVVEPEPATHFTNMLNLKYAAAKSAYDNILRTGEGAERFAEWIEKLGYNAVMGMAYNNSRVVHTEAIVEQLVRERPELGPWESYYRPSGRDKLMSALLRRNIRFYEDVFTYNDTMLPRDPRILAACQRFLALEAASMRSNPAFRGLSLYDEFYTSGDSGSATPVVQANYAAQEVSYRLDYEKEGYTSSRALKAFDRWIGRPPGQRDPKDLLMYRSWTSRDDHDWRDFSVRMSRVAKRVVPDSQNFTLMRVWGSNGGNLGPNGTPRDAFAGLDAAATVMYKDGGAGDRPVFAPLMANVMRVRADLPVWTQLHDYHAGSIYSNHNLRQAFFALGEKVEGFTSFTLNTSFESNSLNDHRYMLRNLHEGITIPYGDFFMSLEKGYTQVAIYFSRQAEYLNLRKPNSIATTAEGLWVACSRAGFPAQFLDDTQLLAGEGDKYKVIFVPGFVLEDETPPEIAKALQKLVDAGKTIIVEKSSKLPIERIVRADSEFDEYDDKMGGAFPRYTDWETQSVLNGSEETSALLRQMLPKYVQPATQTSMLFSPNWLKRGQGQFLVMSNFAPAGFTGLSRTLYQAPDAPTIRFPRRTAAAVYDVLEMKPVSVSAEGDWMTLEADLRDYPGKIYAFLPAAIDRVTLQASAKVPAGGRVEFAAAVADASGQAIDSSFPLEVTLADPSGRVRYRVNRAASPQFRGVYSLPVNAPAGAWKLRVRELISGCVSESTIQVEQGGAVSAQADARPVWVRDRDRVKEFVGDKTPATVVVDRDQAWVRKQAERLADALTRAGKPTRVAWTDEVLTLPGAWDHKNPTLDGSRLWRGDVVQPGLLVDGPVILLGKRFESRLIEGIVRRDALVESPSNHFPGAGRAIVAWVPLAFCNTADAVLVMAEDESGLGKGIDALVASELPAETPIRQLPRMTADASAALSPGAPAGRATTSFRRNVGMIDTVMSVDVDPATGRVLVGTWGYGQNAFCFDAQGKLLWKTFLPEHNVYSMKWYDEGKRILAATGRGPDIFMVNPADGKVLRKFVSSEWPDGHGYDGMWEGQTNTEVRITFNAALRQILVQGRTGLLTLDYDCKKLWFNDRALAITAYPQTAEQTTAAMFNSSLVVAGSVLSPDGTKIAHGEYMIVGSTPGKAPGEVSQLWAYRPMILDAKTGARIAYCEADPGSVTSPGGWSVAWPAGSENPLVLRNGLAAPLMPDGTLGAYQPHAPGTRLAGGKRVLADDRQVTLFDASGKPAWTTTDDLQFLDEGNAYSPDGARMFRCDVDGTVRCVDLSTGKPLWDARAPFAGRPTPTQDGGVLIGSIGGTVTRLDAAGKPVWNVAIIDLFERPKSDYPGYVFSANRRDVDRSNEIYTVASDQPGDFNSVFRMGVEQLKNTSFESQEAWTSTDGAVTMDAPAKDGEKSLSLPTGQLVTQRLTQRIIPQGTYLLEFWFRVPDEATRLVAGGMLIGEGDKQSLTAARYFGRPGEWTFGRLAIKAMADTRTIDIGFQSEHGVSRVDLVSLRAVRFPSANLLANSELHAVEPTFVKDLRVQYDRIPGAVRDRLMSRNHVAVYRQGPSNTATIYCQEQAFLHNGRLDDLGPFWSNPPDPMGFSSVLTKPSWVSHIVLYLNNAAPENTYRFISVLANNMETRIPEQVALVRGNMRRFVVVKLDKPIYTDSIKVLSGFHGGHRESLTEMELYGPLGGPDASAAGFPDDADAYPMFMGGPTHVPAKLPADPNWAAMAQVVQWNTTASYTTGITTGNQLMAFGNAAGTFASAKIAPPTEAQAVAAGPNWALAGGAPLGTPARYGGRLLVGSVDFQLHAVSDRGVYLWGFKTGGRVYSSPLPNGDDVYLGSDDGRLYKVDLHSGMLLWEFVTGDRVRSSPALANGRVYVASFDGFLYAVDVESGRQVWKAPIARNTRCSPAIADGKVYIGDEEGQLRCFDAASGSPIWKQAIGGYLSTCPLVTPEGVVAVSDQGNVALVDAKGAVKWKKDLSATVKGAPFATRTQVLIPSMERLWVLSRADGEPAAGYEGIGGGVLSAVVYQGKVGLVRASMQTNFAAPPRTFGLFSSNYEVWAPKAAAPAK